MKGKLFLCLLLCLTASAGFCQVDASIWKNVMKIEDNKYILNLPDQWKKVTVTEGAGMDYKFDFAGIGIPGMVGPSPLYANFTITRLKGYRKPQAMDQVLTDFSSFYDRITEQGYNYDTSSATIKSGQTGLVVHSRYYRRSKVSNYSKYYLIIYSQKADETYILSMNFQYKDPTYDIERSAQFGSYATQVFQHFEFR